MSTGGRIEELADRLELDLERKIGDLSKGNKQKVGIVAAFMHDPELLILDEPTSGLDPLRQEDVLELVRERPRPAARSSSPRTSSIRSSTSPSESGSSGRPARRGRLDRGAEGARHPEGRGRLAARRQAWSGCGGAGRPGPLARDGGVVRLEVRARWTPSSRSWPHSPFRR